jgi:hypothetical protein
MQHFGGKSHFFGDHEGGMNNKSPYKSFLQKFKTIQQPIKKLIVNCTDNSALKEFRQSTLEEEL